MAVISVTVCERLLLRRRRVEKEEVGEDADEGRTGPRDLQVKMRVYAMHYGANVNVNSTGEVLGDKGSWRKKGRKGKCRTWLFDGLQTNHEDHLVWHAEGLLGICSSVAAEGLSGICLSVWHAEGLSGTMACKSKPLPPFTYWDEFNT